MIRAALFGLLLGALSLAGCASSLVDAECRAGLTLCDGRCVDLARDTASCGGCGVACEPGAACVSGACEPAGDAGVGGDGEIAGDGGTADGGTPGDGGDGGGVLACDLGELECDGTCVRADVDPFHCGGCGLSCAAGEVCSAGACAKRCAAPLVACGELCVDTQSDPDHCGACGVRCESGICIDGECSVGEVGHVVLVGHNYATSRAGMNRVAGNGVFLARGAPVRVVAFEGASLPAWIDGANAAIDQVATATGRTWSRSRAEANEVPLRLARADVLLVYAQDASDEAMLAWLGRTWSVALDTFLRRGGVVVVLDGGGRTATYRILQGAGLFDADARSDISGAFLDVVAPGDAIAVGVPVRYRAEATSVRFEAADMAGAVVSDGSGAVVVHRVVTP